MQDSAHSPDPSTPPILDAILGPLSPPFRGESGRVNPRVAVIGLGNVLLGDDGFGPFVVEQLRAGWDFPADVEVIDAGTPGLDLVTFLDGRECVVLLDAVGADGPPGDLRLYSGEDLRRIPPKPRVSPHDPAVQEALGIVELAGRGPRRVVLIGAIPGSLELGAGISSALRAAATAAVDVVLAELVRCGAPAEKRGAPRPADPWWLRPVPARPVPGA